MTTANELTVLAEGPFEPQTIDVTWAGAAPMSQAAANYIEMRWAVYMADAAATGRTLFNAPITRLVSVNQHGGRLKLELGPTDYKTFVVTTLRDRAWFVEHAPAAMTPAVGNSVLLTRGGEALLGIRSHKTSAYGGRAHLLGGVLDDLGPVANVEGIVAHLRKELLEEASLGAAMLDEKPTLLIVARDNHLAQPELVWQWEMRADPSAIGRRLEAAEHDGYEIVRWNALSRTLHERMTPVARGACDRWKNSPR